MAIVLKRGAIFWDFSVTSPSNPNASTPALLVITKVERNTFYCKELHDKTRFRWLLPNSFADTHFKPYVNSANLWKHINEET